MTVALLFVATLLLVGVILRHTVPLFRWLYIPASVIAGFVGLLMIQLGLGYSEAGNLHFAATSMAKTLSSWPGWLIAVVFAGMLLERKPPSASEGANRVGRQGLMVWIIVLGQTAIGLLATWLLVKPFYEVPNSFGMLIETGFAGGHGTAAAMGEVFAHPTIALDGGLDLGILMATGGLVYGIITGILWINVGVRAGWVSASDDADTHSIDSQHARGSIGEARIQRETIDPLLLQVIWLSLAMGIGLLMQWVVMQTATSIDSWFAAEIETDAAQKQLSQRLSVSSVVDFPLFIYTLFGGLIVRWSLSLFGQAERIDTETINRLTSAAMDILVVAAIASLNLQAVVAMIVPFSALFVCGCLWAAVCLLLISRWILPREHWFQLGLINYGMSTGTTATGFVLLRMVDPELESGAAEDYALAAPLSAPFVGGGMITVAMPLLLLERIPIALSALLACALVIVMITAGRRWSDATDTLQRVSD
ncbi:MAG: sodium:glutamate symporter [Pirellulaceae bacterium]|nr:sodium:glutamate symporter [Pirellulaceae bacterium]